MNEERNMLYQEGIIPTAEEVALNYGFRKQFNPKMLKRVDKWDDTISNEQRKKRVDLTNMNIVTIDGEDTKDFDDAIFVERLSHGMYRLIVSIADVAHFVREDSLLDKEALERGTSVYLIDTVLPMLPRKLSNDLCSLMPQKERLALTVEMQVNKRGDVVKHKIYESIIKSKTKLTYENVNAFLKGDEELNVHDSIIGTDSQWQIELMMEECSQLANILKKKRERRGMLDFDFPEAYIELDKDHKPLGVKARDRGIANRMIEEFMILTNETVAKRFNDMGVPFCYRIHETPNEESIEQVFEYISELGYEIPKTIQTKHIQGVINQAKGTKEQSVVELMLLQSLKQAKYYQDELGHFGLGCEYYSHFTSPIRRYPDLFIHRIIKEWLNNTLTSTRNTTLKPKAELISRLSSVQERKAQQVEIEYDNIKKAEYMLDHIGEVYEGTINVVYEDQCRVVLDNTISGVVRINPKEYELEGYSLIAIDGDSKIAIGDRIKVKVTKVILEDSLIIFDFL